MNIVQYSLQVKGNFSQKGFGFTCMQLAYKNNMAGSLFYESGESVILEISGDEEDLLNVINQCKKQSYINEIFILNKTKTQSKLTDFIMLNQID